MKCVNDLTLPLVSNPYGGWSADEWLKFTAIIAQYPAKLCNRRTLYIDRLLREFPHKSRAEIVRYNISNLGSHMLILRLARKSFIHPCNIIRRGGNY